ncbi:MAG: hypothetical protein JW993_01740 [Sedimentisphaerales bacterium]|nr:hypothetical protein [Sedimentisphaerales bacterium]
MGAPFEVTGEPYTIAGAMVSAEPALTEVAPEPAVTASEAPDVTTEPNVAAGPAVSAESGIPAATDGGQNLWLIAVVLAVMVIGAVVTRLRKRPTT